MAFVSFRCMLNYCHEFTDFAENRLKLAEILYYKILENIMVQELKRHHGKDMAVSNHMTHAEVVFDQTSTVSQS